MERKMLPSEWFNLLSINQLGAWDARKKRWKFGLVNQGKDPA